ncbi:MAG: hypothetical protein A2511_15015 [Deltaproteobacteria bacterium RIFOXYD12_FULL_50_9]|nr:MAG: hypothetical protein A2511_15015 [Deltaproteobacteria bacterium RIFOXYD12_FULL_50_9]
MITTSLEKIGNKEIAAYERPKNLRATSVPFTGSPRNHPIDTEKIQLVTDAFSRLAAYYEFRADDIAFIEELASLVDPEGEVAPMVRVWVKRSSIGLRAFPFLVDEPKMSDQES